MTALIVLAACLAAGGVGAAGIWLLNSWMPDTAHMEHTWCPTCRRLTCCGAICWECDNKGGTHG